MEAIAKLNNCPTSPRKMRLVANMIRSMNVEKALNILRYTGNQNSKRVEKLLLSAISNWERKNEGMRVEDSGLFIKSIQVDGGRVLKRFRPAPHGRANRIIKRSNHVTLVVDSKVKENKNSRQEETDPKAAAVKEDKKGTPRSGNKKETKNKE